MVQNYLVKHNIAALSAAEIYYLVHQRSKMYTWTPGICIILHVCIEYSIRDDSSTDCQHQQRHTGHVMPIEDVHESLYFHINK